MDNICSVCLGDGKVYNLELIDNKDDINSAPIVDCPACNGTGRLLLSIEMTRKERLKHFSEITKKYNEYCAI